MREGAEQLELPKVFYFADGGTSFLIDFIASVVLQAALQYRHGAGHFSVSLVSRPSESNLPFRALRDARARSPHTVKHARTNGGECTSLYESVSTDELPSG